MSRPRITAAVVTALAAGSLVSTGPALAGTSPLSMLPAASRAAIPSAPCQPDGVAEADKAVANQVRPAMNGKRLGSTVDGYAVSCARAIVSNVRTRGLGQRAAVIAVTTAIAESSLHNYTVAVDHDSLGLFQQRPSQGWGRPGELVDPRHATNAFLNALLRKNPNQGWLSGDIGQICQRVQGSAFPLAYAPEVHDAQLLVTALWPQAGTPAVSSPSAPGPAVPEAPAKKASGPFQNTLVAVGTGQGPTDARHDMSMADWNGDRRPDLVVVQKSGTASGRTELYVLDATSALPKDASSFQHLLLHTGTALGATDDRHAFSMADWNGDGRLDLVVVQRSGTASGRTELRVVDGASGFQRYLLETGTILGATDDRHEFSMADWNSDGRLDLVAVQKAGTAGKKTEVRVLDGVTGFQTYLLETATVLGETDGRHDFTTADWNGDGRLDLVVVQKAGTASKKTEVRVLDGAANFARYRVQSRTALGPTDDRYAFSVADWNGDGRLDLVTVQKSGTASGRTEARILAG